MAMRTTLLLACLTLALAGINPLAARAGGPTNTPATGGKPCTFVIVHGAWGGGWDWRPCPATN